MGNLIQEHLGLGVVFVAAVLLLLAIGFRDVLRFSFTRMWAISTVAFQQSIRRRVLWITPLVIVGIVIVSQLQKAIDAQDMIRQSTTVCLFATGMLIMLVSIILACTNLPREIESRVIYTVATKPATRLEIILGKVIGFARVSFVILLIMGLFTWGYLKFRDWRIRSYISNQLASGAVDEFSRPTLEHYRDRGTLHARELGMPRLLSIYSHEPQGPEDRWIPGESEGSILARFMIDRSFIPAPQVQQPGPALGPAPPPVGGVIMQVVVNARKIPGYTPPAPPTTGPTTSPAAAPRQPQRPHISINVLNRLREAVAGSYNMGAPNGWEVPDDGVVQVYLAPDLLAKAAPVNQAQSEIYLEILGLDGGYEYTSRADGIAIVVPETRQVFRPTSDLIFAGRQGQYGQQVRGGKTGIEPVGIYEFRGLGVSAGRESYMMELRLGVERLEDDQATRASVQLVNKQSGKRFDPIEMFVETNRPTYFEVPAEAVRGGDFDVIIRARSNAWLGLRMGSAASVKLVKGDESFAWNLAKSLGVLWLMSVLVVIISVFCSTFLSWPIAVVLTVMILSGRWMAMQVGDMAQPGVGRQIVTDMLRTTDAASARAVSESVDALVKMLNIVSSVLPDISQFSAIEDIQQGVAISPSRVLLPSLAVALAFGIPLVVLSYVFLKYKEVAP